MKGDQSGNIWTATYQLKPLKIFDYCGNRAKGLKDELFPFAGSMEVTNAKAAEREAVGHFLACKEMSLSLFVHFFYSFFFSVNQSCFVQ